jgi:hypothetical protein
MDLKAAVEALRSDARTWDGAGQAVEAPEQAIGGLGLTPSDVMMYGVDKGIDKTYAAAQNALSNMLGQAAENFHNLAGALRHAADMYDETEAAHQQRVQRASGH